MKLKYPDLYLKLMDHLITLETERKLKSEGLAPKQDKPLSRGQKKRLRYHKRTGTL